MKIKNKIIHFILLLFLLLESTNTTFAKNNNKSLKKKTNSINFIVLAGGKGSRMNSVVPKTLKDIFGKTMLERVIDSCKTMEDRFNIKILPVISEEMYIDFNDLIPKNIKNVEYVIEKERKGTAAAVKLSIPYFIENSDYAIIMLGDTPFVKKQTLEKLINCIKIYDLCTLAFVDREPNKFGKMILKSNKLDNFKIGEMLQLEKIKESKDYEVNEIQPILCNSGMHIHKVKDINKNINQIKIWEKTGEMNINDIIEVSSKEGLKIGTVIVEKNEVISANTPEEFEEMKKVANEVIHSSKKDSKKKYLKNHININSERQTFQQ